MVELEQISHQQPLTADDLMRLRNAGVGFEMCFESCHFFFFFKVPIDFVLLQLLQFALV